ncbi:MAG: nucleotide exchange factor GrpE [Lachnospiraceae bacterium]|nr:nucleotide exchange factor GrpE [Lachnospiraceae bacterium]
MAEQETKMEDQNLETPEMENQEVEDTDASEEQAKASPETEDVKEDDKAEKKGFGKGKKKDKKEDAYKQQITDLEDRVMRQMAEFENFRRRTEKEKTAMFETGAKSVIEKILPVVDNFERGLATIPEEDKGTPFAEGMAMIYKQLMTELEGIGVKPIQAVGQEFDPNLHNAVMQVESEEYESGVIAQELMKGYTYRESVVRHSMVAVTQ